MENADPVIVRCPCCGAKLLEAQPASFSIILKCSNQRCRQIIDCKVKGHSVTVSSKEK